MSEGGANARQLAAGACGCVVVLAVIGPVVGALLGVLGAVHAVIAFVPCGYPLLLAAAAATVYAHGPAWAGRIGRALARRDA